MMPRQQQFMFRNKSLKISKNIKTQIQINIGHKGPQYVGFLDPINVKEGFKVR